MSQDKTNPPSREMPPFARKNARVIGVLFPLATQIHAHKKPNGSLTGRFLEFANRPHSASEVFVTGTFDDWGKTVQLERVGDVFMKEVSLPLNKKVQYKFVVDGVWTTDSHAREENDGHDNINNVLLPEDIQTETTAQSHLQEASTDNVTAPATMSGVTPDSTTAALASQVPKEEANDGLPGTFPETPAQETEQVLSVNPIPASGGFGNPITLQPGEKVPEPSSIHTNTVDSTVKLDKESYEKSDSLPAGSAGFSSDTAAAGAFAVPADTTNLIPESSLPMGGPAQQAAMADPGYTIQSAAPTSTTAALAAEVPLEKSKHTNGTAEPAEDVPEVVKESLATSHQSPEAAANEEAVLEKQKFEDELHERVPVDQSTGAPAPTTIAKDVPETVKESIAESHQGPEAAANEEAVAEKKQMEDELHQRVPVEQSTGAPAPTIVAPATTTTTAEEPVKSVPEIVKESFAESEQDPEAAANREAVEEKQAMERELQKTVPVVETAGAPAPTTTAATQATAPGAGSLSVPPMDSADVSPTSTPPPERVGPTSAAPTSAPDATKTQEAPIVTTGVNSSETAAKSTPNKPVDPAQQSTKTAGSGELHAKEDKKKKRLSGFFSKLKEKLK
ncbi:hypothetical protein PDE_04687 [Penicillium oxalicum 114-2]|uniref:AMP-activated protein kinase glycogen-binding domain-containing protein n=1 Tax=Penicillium oxalicum (strain 114-2 / CGMCC 5302) TaxID=933388 RepID=S8B591_PENO1|nr:hypothetical protein PDE_04687 [Penicillium oxalicum 114-2]